MVGIASGQKQSDGRDAAHGAVKLVATTAEHNAVGSGVIASSDFQRRQRHWRHDADYSPAGYLW